MPCHGCPFKCMLWFDSHVWNVLTRRNLCNCIPLGATCCYHKHKHKHNSSNTLTSLPLFYKLYLVNAGRGFSALPILTAAASSGGSASKPHLPHDHTPNLKLDESSREGSPSVSGSQSTDGCPEDALFPGKKGGAAKLFLGDCLGVKSKPDQTRSNPP